MAGYQQLVNLLKVVGSRGSFTVATFLFFLALSAGGWYIYSSLETEAAQSRFDGSVREISLRINERLLGYEQVLHGAMGFMSSSDNVSREDWRRYIEHLRLSERYPGVQGVGFAQHLEPNQLHEHVQHIRDEGFANYKVWPEGKRDIYTSIVYLEPFRERNLRAFGYDMYSEPVRRQAMSQSRDTGNTSITGKVLLVQETQQDVQAGFLMYLPFYQPGMPQDTVAERRKAIVGYVYAPFRARNFMSGILGESALDLDLELYDGSEITPAALLYDGEETEPEDPLFTRTFSINQFGRDWSIRVKSLPQFEATVDQQKPFIVLVGGTVMGLLFSGLSWSFASNREKSVMLMKANNDLMKEVTQHEITEGSLHLYKRAIESSLNPILITDPNKTDNPIVYVNPAFERVTGYSQNEAIGKNCRFLQGEDRQQTELEKVREIITRRIEGHAVLRNYKKNGQLFWNELYISPVKDRAGRVTHFVGVQNDFTETRNYQEQLEHQATHDLLTGVANRGLLSDRIRQAIYKAERTNHKIAVIFVDLDNFKMINDSMGHAAGDEVLKISAERLGGKIRKYDSISRIGGDEFVIVLDDQKNSGQTAQAAERIMQDLMEPMDVQGRQIVLTCSLGISMYPEDGNDVDELLKKADAAMYKGKSGGKNTYNFYKQDMEEDAVQRLALVNDLRQALKRGEFVLQYQPKINLETGDIDGFEALIRWRHPEYGMISPVQFIPLAEEIGQINAIGEWVLRTACARNREIVENYGRRLVMAVNLSVRQLVGESILGQVRRVLDETNLAPELLELELTESMIMQDVNGAISLFKQLKSIGVRLSIDDFGTGYSSLSYLRQFPIDCLKIDKSFIRHVITDAGDAAIAKAIVAMAHSLGIKVVAEGVETQEQVDFLRQFQCDQAQGYLFSKPLGSELLAALLSQGSFTFPSKELK